MLFRSLFGENIFSIGMLIFSPDMFLFPFFSVKNAIFFHLIIVSCFAGLLNYNAARKFDLHKGVSFFFAVFFIFSTPIMARISEGHIQLLGYMFIPTFFGLILDLEKKADQATFYKLIFFYYNPVIQINIFSFWIIF